MFKYLITINPLGFMYGSAGGFLSPENLVGCSGSKFPPDAATLAGLFFSVNKIKSFSSQEDLRDNLFVAGPFWAKSDEPEYFYLPIPWHKIINTKEGVDEWEMKDRKWSRTSEFQPDSKYQRINYWHDSPSTIKNNDDGVSPPPWQYVPILHPRTKNDERCVLSEDGLFLENAVQMDEDSCLVYLSTYRLDDGWYRFGGESHLVEIKTIELTEDSWILELLRQPIQRTFALITPGVWGSNKFSFRYPKHDDFSEKRPEMLTDRPVPYRYRLGNNKILGDEERHHHGRLGRGRYAVPAGTVYVLREPLNKPWWEWPEHWFPNEGFSLKQLGCGLSLPITIKGVD
ncbi:MAG: hypothetical protein RLZZ338_2654 [Cyanobacteriota bacterium]|jgi:CRISPR-associated protein Cmr3